MLAPRTVDAVGVWRQRKKSNASNVGWVEHLQLLDEYNGQKCQRENYAPPGHLRRMRGEGGWSGTSP